MPEYLHPGVYVVEEPSGIEPIEGASLSTPCFVGRTQQGRPDMPKMITGWEAFERRFGKLKASPSPWLSPSVYFFFQNGGRRTYVLRVAPGTDGASGLGPADYERALRALDRVEDIGALVIPGAADEVAAVGAAYASRRDIPFVVFPQAVRVEMCIDGEPAEHLFREGTSLEVRHDADGTRSFSLELGLRPEDGGWDSLDDWTAADRRVTVTVDDDALFEGRVTSVQPTFAGPDSRLSIRGAGVAHDGATQQGGVVAANEIEPSGAPDRPDLFATGPWRHLVWFRPQWVNPPAPTDDGEPPLGDDWRVPMVAEGEVDTALYGATLRPGSAVRIRGCGQLFSGTWHVRKVVHHISPGTYMQWFQAHIGSHW